MSSRCTYERWEFSLLVRWVMRETIVTQAEATDVRIASTRSNKNCRPALSLGSFATKKTASSPC